jgi:hypothetical protein
MIDFNSDISIEHTHKEGRKRKEDEKEKKTIGVSFGRNAGYV